MSKDEFKDTLFDLLNESEIISIEVLTLDDKSNTIIHVLTDDTSFLIYLGETY